MTSTCYGGGSRDVQPYPRRGPLAKHVDLPLDGLLRALAGEHAMLYAYVVATVCNEGGRFVQRGTAPNFQGGRITLCTCKHQMRTYADLDAWVGRWVAGFAGVQAGGGRNALVYLMRVGQAFASHADLWRARTIPEATKQAKAADAHRLGDLYRPRDTLRDPSDPRQYVPPRPDHEHAAGGGWHADISYPGRIRRPAALLVGDPARSYLWERPLIFAPAPLGRGEHQRELGDLLGQLELGGELGPSAQPAGWRGARPSSTCSRRSITPAAAGTPSVPAPGRRRRGCLS